MQHVMQNAQTLGTDYYSAGHIGSVVSVGRSTLVDRLNYSQALQAMTFQQKAQGMTGTKPLVVCGGVVNEAKDMDDAQRMAEESAHAQGKNAYILKPVKMVAPKRDVVTTDL